MTDKSFRDLLKVDLSSSELIQKAKNRIKHEFTDQEIQNVQEYLQSVFYGEEKNDNLDVLHNRLMEALKKYFQELVDTTIYNANDESYFQIDEIKDLSISQLRNSNKNSGQFLSESFNFTNKQQTIKVKTLQNKLEDVKQSLEKLDLDNFNLTNQELNQARDKIIGIEQQLEYLINNECKDGKTINIKDNRELLNHIKKIYAELGTLDIYFLNKNELGYTFEKAIQAVSGGITKKTVSKLYDLLKKDTMGTSLTKRGSFLKSDAVISALSIDKTENDTTTVQFGGSNDVYTFKGIYNDKQGKIDVCFKLPPAVYGNSPTFRISAKNWNNINDDHNLGSTRLLHALMRTSGLDKTLAYAVQLRAAEETSITQAHLFAQLNVILDVLMGYSQKQGYADVLVINNRKQTQIQVYSIQALIEKAKEQGDALNLMGYDKYNAVQAFKRQPFCYSSALAYMKEIQIKVQPSALGIISNKESNN